MSSIVPLSLLVLFRRAPVRTALFVGCPVFLAGAQLANSYVNGLSFLVSVPFAIVMLAFATVLARHVLATIRLRRLERTTVVAGD